VDRLAGKVDATTNRRASRLDVNAVHQDVLYAPDMTTAVHAELEALARWLGLDHVRNLQFRRNLVPDRGLPWTSRGEPGSV
jgi:uncharacterized protein YcaQ